MVQLLGVGIGGRNLDCSGLLNRRDISVKSVLHLDIRPVVAERFHHGKKTDAEPLAKGP